MAEGQAGHVVLLPIHPRFVNAIRRGTKKVELRRTRFARDVRWVVLYCTAPVQKVVGHFRVDGVHEGAPAELWDRFQDVSCLDRAEFMSYFRASRKGYAIGVADLSMYGEPLALGDLLPGSSPPQSFTYLPLDVFLRLKRSASAKPLPAPAAARP